MFSFQKETIISTTRFFSFFYGKNSVYIHFKVIVSHWYMTYPFNLFDKGNTILILTSEVSFLCDLTIHRWWWAHGKSVFNMSYCFYINYTKSIKCWVNIETYKMASSKDPIEVKVFVWLNKASCLSVASTVQRCSVLPQEILEPFPST